VARLKQRGFEIVETLPVVRADWLRVIGGLLDADFRDGNAPPETAFGWYLDRVDDAVEELQAQNSGEKVLLVAHSAGGWLARAALGRRGAALASRVRGLVTLGAPHRAPPKEPPGDDQTQGALRFVDEQYPGAFLQKLGIEYITVAGAAVMGSGDSDRGTAAKEAWISYQRLVGRGEVPGDGIVPSESAHLPGAVQVTLPEVKHSIGTPTEWYGADEVIDQWLPQVTWRLGQQAAFGQVFRSLLLQFQQKE